MFKLQDIQSAAEMSATTELLTGEKNLLLLQQAVTLVTLLNRAVCNVQDGKVSQQQRRRRKRLINCQSGSECPGQDPVFQFTNDLLCCLLFSRATRENFGSRRKQASPPSSPTLAAVQTWNVKPLYSKCDGSSSHTRLVPVWRSCSQVFHYDSTAFEQQLADFCVV